MFYFQILFIIDNWTNNCCKLHERSINQSNLG